MTHGKIVYQYTKTFFCKTDSQVVVPHCSEDPEVILSERQDFAFPFVELQEVSVCLFL